VTAPEPLVEYIRANRDRFTREAINAQLLEGGHAQWSIDAAWAALEAADRPDALRRKPGIGTILLVLAVIAGYGFCVYVALAFAYLTGGTFLDMTGPEATVLVPYGIAMIIGCVISVALLLRAPSTGGGARAIWIAFGISFAVFVGLSGLCLAGLSASG
jgi:hypothetical protein